MGKKRKQKRKKRNYGKYLVPLFGLILIPISILLMTFVINFIEITFKCGDVEKFLWGIAIYPPIHLLVWRPYFIHVAAHEFSHALFAKLFLGRVYELHIDSEDSGSVTMSRKNFIINLAPYFFPLYSSISLLIYLAVKNSFKPYFAYISGFLLSMHYIMNIRDLNFKQPDIIESGGKLFSLPFIATINLSILILFIYVLSDFELSMGDFYYTLDRIHGTIEKIRLFI
jgi:hypothetical protein